MLRAVLVVEWSSFRRDRSIWVLLAVFAAFIAYAAAGGSRLVATERAAISAAEREERQRFERLRREVSAIGTGAPVRHAADPRNPLQVGRELFPRAASLPPAPLAGIAVGQRDLLPRTLELTTRERVAHAGHDGASPTRHATGAFDLAFVLVFLLPLLVLATSYDLLSGERERGTLALVLSQPVSLATFLLGKVAQRALVLTGFVAALALAGALLAGARLSAPGALLDLGVFLLLVGVYVVFWLALALAVNAWGRSSAANALSLVAAWIALAMVVPGLAGVAVDTLAPTPSRAELVNLTREAARDAGSEFSAIEGNHGLDPGTVGRRAVRVQEELERRVEPVLERFEEQLALQQRLVDRLRFASPVLLVHEGLTDVAGSGVARHQHFSAKVTRFHDELKEFFASRVLAGKRLSEVDYDAMPRFVYDEAPRGEALARVSTGIASMAAMTAVLFGVAMVRLRRRRI